MSIKTKRIIFIILELLGIIWNGLCLFNIIPLKYYAYSVVWVFGYLLVSELMPVISLMYREQDEKSVYIKELTEKEKALASISFTFGIAWLTTIVACIVY